jgi:uncharacterized protein (TIGR03437 family)
VLFESATAITFQVPFTISGSSASLQVNTSPNGSTISSSVVTVPVAPTAPGLYTTNGTGAGTGYYFSPGGLFSNYSQPVLAGATVELYGTGFGVTNPVVAAGVLGPNSAPAVVAAVTMTIDNQSVPVTASLEPGNVGYDQVVFTVPSTLTVPTNQTQASFPVVVTVGGVSTQTVNLIVAAPALSITSITPNPVPLSASPQTVTFTGTGFQAGLTLQLAAPNGQQSTISGANITVISATQFTAQITVGTTAGTWNALVTNANGDQSSVVPFSASGTGPIPTITSVVTTWGDELSQAPQIAQNTWIEVHGSNLSTVSSLTWSTLPASDFVNSLPTSLGGVTATVNGKAAAIYYVSPTQVNILAPLDTATGSVPVQLNTPNGQTAAYNATEVQTSPAFLVIDTAGHVAAQDATTYAMLGPATPAKPGELVVLYATGLGQTFPAITNQATGTGPLLTLPSMTIGGTPAIVGYAGLSGAGLYQFNVTVPQGTPNGDATVTASYTGSPTQNVLLPVHQ